MARPDDELELLKGEYPGATYYLRFDTPFHLLLATILSAQCTDVAVNKATPALFARYARPEDVLASSEEELCGYITTITFFQAKARHIMRACAALVRDFGSEVPSDLAKLVSLAGVGRKTANAIQQNAFGIVEGVIVDTHVIRIAQRLRWTLQKDPERIERDLVAIFPKGEWKRLPHLLKAHGQRCCTAQRPACGRCPLRGTCPSAGKV